MYPEEKVIYLKKDAPIHRGKAATLPEKNPASAILVQ